LKRDIKLFIEKCALIVTQSKTMSEENKLRARQRDEEIIDLEWKIEKCHKEIDGLKEENSVLTGDCHRLLENIQNSSTKIEEVNERKLHTARLHDALKAQLRQLSEKLAKKREDYASLMETYK